jgi:hypothetical protein
MRRIAVNGCQPLVQPILGEVRRVDRHVEAEASQARRTNENEESRNRLDSRIEIPQSFPNQIGTGQCVGDIHDGEFRASCALESRASGRETGQSAFVASLSPTNSSQRERLRPVRVGSDS